MRTRPLLPVLTALGATALVAAGCGGDGGPATTADTPGAAADRPDLTITFATSGITASPTPVTLPADGELDVAFVAADGRPHGVVVTFGGQRTHLLIDPGGTLRRGFAGVTAGRYRIVPDGASDPVAISVEK